MARTLFAITADLEALDDLLAEVEGDLTDEKVAAAVDQWFAELDNAFLSKVDNYAAYILELISRARCRAEEAARLKRRADIDEGLAKSLKVRLMMALEQRGKKKVETDRFRVSIAGNGGLEPLALDEVALPDDFRRVADPRLVPDTAKIRDALGRQEKVPGAELLPRGQHLSIR